MRNTKSRPEKPAEPGEEKEYVKRLAIFVHYAADQKVSPADMYLLRDLKKCADIVFVSNSGLIQDSMKKVSRIVPVFGDATSARMRLGLLQ